MKKLLILLFYSAASFAIGTNNEGHIVMHGTTERINVHATCKKVVNAHGTNDYFIPTKTSPEWTSFVTYPPTNVTFSNCDVTYRSCLDIKRAIPASTSGKYTIDPDGVGVGYPAFDTYCDMTNDGGGWTLVMSNTIGGTNKPFTNLNWVASTTTGPLCSLANGATTGCGARLNNNKETFNYYLGLDYWNRIAQQNSNIELRHEWRTGYGAAIAQSKKWNIKKFAPSQLYLLSANNYADIVGTQVPGFYSYQPGNYFSSYDLENDTSTNEKCSEGVGSKSPYWYGSCWNGSVYGWGENGTGFQNASFFYFNIEQAGDADGIGAGNGWVFIREYEYPANCTEIKSKNLNVPTGQFWIDPDGAGGASPIQVFCDMTTDGGGWTLLLNQKSDTGGFFTNDAQAQSYNVLTPNADRYSILSQTEKFRSLKGNFTFRMNWPGFAKKNIWQQRTDPTIDQVIKGYVPLIVDSPGEGWGGLERRCANDCTKSFMDGTISSSSWLYSVGSYTDYTLYGGSGIAASVAVKGAGVPQVQLWVRDDSFNVNYPRDCQDILENGQSSGDGVYSVDPKNTGSPMQVYCDMTSDGGGWTLVFNHKASAGYFTNATDASSKNTTAPTSNLYSILNKLDDFKANGRYLFKMNWPTYNKRNIWAQTSNPTSDLAVSGYVGLAIDSTSDSWGGLERNCTIGCTSSYMDGSAGNAATFYSLGTYAAFGTPAGIKSSADVGGATVGVPQVQLWTRRSEGQLTKRSCKEILDAGLSTGDGFYLIDPDGVGGSYYPVRVYCDMTRDNGGWTRVSVNNGTGTMASDFFINTYRRDLIGNPDLLNMAASINPDQFSKLVGTTDAMLVASDYAGSPFIENGMGVWDYDVAKCTGTLLHTSISAGCAGQAANINFSTTHQFNISFLSGAQGISPSSTPLCTGHGNCSFEFYLR